MEQTNKRIALIFSGDFPEGNTKNARLKVIAKKLLLENWESTFVTTYPSSFSTTIHSAQPSQWNGLKIVYTSISKTYFKIKLLRHVQVIMGQLGLILFLLFTHRKYDAYYFYSPRFTDTMLGLRMLKLLKKTVVVDQTELFSTEEDSKTHALEEEWLKKYPDVLLVISSNLYEYFGAQRKNRLYKFPIMVDFQRFEIEREEIPYLMGYIGSFAEKDDVQLLLDATKKLLPHFPKLKLRLIGYNPKMNELYEKLSAMQLTEHVEVTGTVAYSDIPWLLNECDTLLMNRDSSTFATYGYPIKLGEYFACRKPVIMSNGMGFSEDFTHRNEVYKYKVNDVESLVDTVKYRYDNIGESDAVAIRGYEYAKDHFASNMLVPFLANILDDL